MKSPHSIGKGRRKRRRAKGRTSTGHGGATKLPSSQSQPKSSQPSDVPEFKSTGYALLDVGEGRFALEKYLNTHPGKKIPVVVYGEIDYPFGSDDGESIEFVLQVRRMTVIKEN